MVVVDDFAVDPTAVQVDPGIGGTLRQSMSGMSGSDAQARDADAVRFGVTDALTQAIGRMGLPVQQATGRPPARPYVVVRGQSDLDRRGQPYAAHRHRLRRRPEQRARDGAGALRRPRRRAAAAANL